MVGTEGAAFVDDGYKEVVSNIMTSGRQLSLFSVRDEQVAHRDVGSMTVDIPLSSPDPARILRAA